MLSSSRELYTNFNVVSHTVVVVVVEKAKSLSECQTANGSIDVNKFDDKFTSNAFHFN